CRLQKTRLGEFYLCLPMPLEIRGENQAPKWTKIEEGILALDPGVRTFSTGYSPSGLTIEWGKNDIGRIYRLCYALDKLQCKWSQKEVRHKKRYKLKRAARRIRKKIRNLIDETQRMVKRANRRIRSKTARAMLGWSHYRLKQRLINKTREYPWCKVIICDEHYTSKTCGNCGYLHNKLGSNKTFKCPQCQIEMEDRDINAARNILLRFLTLNRAKSSGSALGPTP
ncbi:35873_t:CDS:2, partial [Racocetra persica]